MATAVPYSPSPLTRNYRLISLAEVAIGTFLVLSHNVFHIMPNEVFMLFALFWISFGLRDGGFKSAGLRQPDSWMKTVLLALAAAAVLQLGSAFVVEPLAQHFWKAPEHISSVLKIAPYDWKLALRSLAIVWTFAAFGEEIGYRGYLLNRAADLGHRSKLAYVLAILYVSVLFGFGHYYKGPSGLVDSAYSGLVLGGVYLISGCNLWPAILAHGISDSFAVLAIFMGWAN